jgi:chromosomal replication initiator protein
MDQVGSSMDEITEIWGKCRPSLQESVSDIVWKTCLSLVTPVEISGDNLTLGVPSPYVRSKVAERFLGLIRDAASGAAGRPLDVTLVIVDAGEVDFDEVFPLPDAPVATPGASSERSIPAVPLAAPSADGIRLDPRFTFETFVSAQSNRMALAAAQTVAESPGRSYNPLFIYGGSGLGKTHLLHAIGNWMVQTRPSSRVLYVTTETFFNDFVESIRLKTQLALKRNYRECDVLLVDDIQFIQNKDALQEELFHTYNTLHSAGKQIVLTSDRPPKSIEKLEDRLRSRLLSGLVAEIEAPDLETRMAILRAKAQFEGIDLPDDVCDFIATNVRDNIRELEGALTRVAAFASLTGEPVSLSLAVQVLPDIGSEPALITPDMILDAVAETYGLTVEELVGPRRARPLVTARHVAMYLIRSLTDYSYPSIGKVFGGRDHSTVISAVDKITAQMGEKRQLYEQVTSLIHQIKGGG